MGRAAGVVRRLLEEPVVPEPDEASAGERGKVIVEHTNINPNKAAHIGHLRNAALGDTFVRVLRYRGHRVVVQNYIDDTGVQLADVVVGFIDLRHMSQADVAALPDGRLLGLSFGLLPPLPTPAPFVLERVTHGGRT